mmetsp:Transcript_63204/g.111946  ORF Transcript_63204/g.111946 Transcript_63204/m.111946 type:complete len:204 (+) Transcript_63204:475-1086(+)
MEEKMTSWSENEPHEAYDEHLRACGVPRPSTSRRVCAVQGEAKREHRECAARLPEALRCQEWRVQHPIDQQRAHCRDATQRDADEAGERRRREQPAMPAGSARRRLRTRALVAVGLLVAVRRRLEEGRADRPHEQAPPEEVHLDVDEALLDERAAALQAAQHRRHNHVRQAARVAEGADQQQSAAALRLREERTAEALQRTAA